MKRRKEIKKVLDALFNEVSVAPSDELPALVETIIDLYRLIANPLRFLFYGFVASVAIVSVHLLISIAI